MNFVNRGLDLHRQGRLEAACKEYEQALRLQPRNADAFHLLGVAKGALGQAAAGIASIRRAIALNAKTPDYHVNLGNLLKQTGQAVEAEACYRTAIRLDPRMAAAHNNLGNLHLDTGRFAEAERSFRQALAIAPGHGSALANLCNVLRELGRADEAIEVGSRAVAQAPQSAEAQANLGAALAAAGHHREALEHLEQARRANPRLVAPLVSLSGSLAALGLLEEAATAAHGALEIEPDSGRARINLGNALKRLGRLQEAAQVFGGATALPAVRREAFTNLAAVCQEMGDAEGAERAYRSALDGGGPPSLAFRLLTTVPMVMADRAEIARIRDRVAQALAEHQDLTVADPLRELGQPNFFLAYHGEDDLPLQRAFAEFHLRACPTQAYIAPHCGHAIAAGRRLRVGILSAFFYNHTIAKMFLGHVERLSRDRFEVVAIATPHPPDRLRQAVADAADRFVVVPEDLGPAREAIAALELDILLYTDIGMSAFTYFLAFARLAPIQCVAFGHPDSPAIPALDYFLTCDAMEPEGGEAHYAEALVRLPGPAVHLCRPSLPAAPKGRAALGLPSDVTVYVCPQTVFKLHPDFDWALAEILRRDPDGRIVLVAGPDPRVDARLLARIETVAGRDVERVQVLPRLSTDDFLGLLAASDVMLDPFHYSGGNTSLEAFAFGLPIVTWPGAFMRGRHTYGFYRLMGIDDAIADSHAAYVELAVGLGRDPGRRAELRDRILAANSVLYESTDTIAAIERFFVEAAGDG